MAGPHFSKQTVQLRPVVLGATPGTEYVGRRARLLVGGLQIADLQEAGLQVPGELGPKPGGPLHVRAHGHQRIKERGVVVPHALADLRERHVRVVELLLDAKPALGEGIALHEQAVQHEGKCPVRGKAPVPGKHQVLRPRPRRQVVRSREGDVPAPARKELRERPAKSSTGRWRLGGHAAPACAPGRGRCARSWRPPPCPREPRGPWSWPPRPPDSWSRAPKTREPPSPDGPGDLSPGGGACWLLMSPVDVGASPTAADSPSSAPADRAASCKSTMRTFAARRAAASVRSS
mmetsp:Transcript_11586/g.39570  ORF Transcript_11586/g.39570 Transcript_11586/m.39570 type:complete len:291 (+) Transcript_11586:693-1565(+)